jgi:CheY-like chemotaxis protein
MSMHNKEKRGQESKRNCKVLFMQNKRRVLCISYDESLLLTRKMILEQAGFEVTPALGFAEAMEACRNEPGFELIVIGHSMPRKDKTAIIHTLRSMQCNAPVLSVRRHNDPPLPEADYSVDSYDGPKVFTAAAEKAIQGEAKSA